MGYWLRMLEDWTSHQDYGWFVAALCWFAVALAAALRRDEKNQRAPVWWLLALAATGIVNAITELLFFAQYASFPYLGFDFFLGVISALGTMALWAPLARGLPRPRAILRLSALVLAGLALATGRFLEPILGGWIWALATTLGIWITVRALRRNHALLGLPPNDQRRFNLGLFCIALWPVITTFGPLAYTFLEGRRNADLGHFALPAAIWHSAAALLLAWSLWAAQLRALAEVSTYSRRNLRSDVRVGLSVLALWLALGAGLSVYNGRQARIAFEQSLISRTQAVVALMDEQAIKNLLNDDLKIGSLAKSINASGQDFELIYLHRYNHEALVAVRQQLTRLAKSDPSLIGVNIAVFGKTRLITLVRATGFSSLGRWLVVIRLLSDEDRRLFAAGKPFVDGPWRQQWRAHFNAFAPVKVITGEYRGRCWVMTSVYATSWTASFAHARLQAMTVTGIGVILWAVAIVYRLRRTEQEWALQRAEQAQNADKAKSEFLAQVSHELRNPLQGVLGYGELLEQEALPPSAHALIGKMRSQGTLMLRLVNDLIDLGALQSGAFRLHLGHVRLRALAEECMDSIRPKATAKRLALEWSYDDSLPEVIEADDARLRQVLLNLLGNAV
ncbi:MAG: hypothetical protein HZA31_11250, partial [Opitutae bacterium]|nr:hypothetical protein [Opitutae bacterium]